MGLAPSPRPGLFIILAALGCTLAPAARPASGLPAAAPLTSARQIRALSTARSAQSIPVHLTGVVTVPSTYHSSFFFMDSTGGISVDRSSDTPAVHAGDRVEIDGTSAPGQFAPLVNASSIRVLGKGALPAPRLYELNELAGGREDSQWISLRGVVRSASIQTIWSRQVLVLDFDMGVGVTIPVQVRDYPVAGWLRLPGSIVRIRGVCGTVFNDRRQFVGLRLFVSSLGDIEVETPSPLDPFATPAVSLDELMQFKAGSAALERIRVQGTVTYSRPGQGFFLEEGQRGVFVRSRQNAPIAIGSRVETVGYLAPGRYSPGLEDAVYRLAGQSAVVSPVSADAAGMISVSPDGVVAAPFDSLLVRLKGELVEEHTGDAEDVLILKDEGRYFSARLAHTVPPIRDYPPGTLLAVTGVSVTRMDDTRGAYGFVILLRSPADIAILRHAPWWNHKHAGWVVSGCLVGLLIVAAVVVFLRRQALLQALAVTDPLTGLYNRRGFLELASHDWELAQRRRATLLLFYIDLDRFKQINDTQGHKAGDLALQTVARILRESFRTSDVVARVGGDEFAVACDADADSPAAIESRIEDAVARHNASPDAQFQLGLSIGAFVGDDSVYRYSLDELIAYADANMYVRKSQRRHPADPESKSTLHTVRRPIQK